MYVGMSTERWHDVNSYAWTSDIVYGTSCNSCILLLVQSMTIRSCNNITKSENYSKKVFLAYRSSTGDRGNDRIQVKGSIM